MNFRYFLVFALLLVAHVIAGVIWSGYAWWWILVTVSALLGLLALACSKITWNFFIRSTNRIPLSLAQIREGYRPIALTFDDGPSVETLSVLDVLKEKGATATFFLIGKNISGNEHIVQRIVDEGHLIGNHTFTHTGAFYMKSVKDMVADISAANTEIKKAVGFEPNIFRPPFGVTNPNLAKALNQLELQSVGWGLRSMDTVSKEPKKLMSKIVSKSSMNQIILLHDRCEITRTILPELIDRLREKGFRFEFPVVMEKK